MVDAVHYICEHDTGNADLTLNGNPIVLVAGKHSSDFTVTSLPLRKVRAGNSDTFTVTFNPSATGTRSAILSISNDDADEDNYTFAIQGTGKTKPLVALPLFIVSNLNASPVRVESSEKVIISAGESLPLSFIVTRDVGSYEIDIGGQKAYFEVISASGLALWWLLIGFGILLLGLLFLFLSKRKQRIRTND